MSMQYFMWMSVLLLSFTGPVASVRKLPVISGRKVPVISGRKIPSSSFIPRTIGELLQLQHVKIRILDELNMTSPPKPLTTRMLTRERKPQPKKQIIPTFVDRSENEAHTKIIMAEVAADDQRMDTMSFKLDSHIRSHINDIEGGLLFIRFRSVLGSSRSKDNDNQMAKQRRRQRKKNKGKEITTNSVENSKIFQNSTGDSTTTNKENAIKQKSRPSRRGRKRGRRVRNLKAWRVKIVVRVVDKTTGQKHRIAVEKLKVKKTNSVRVKVPKEFLIAAAESDSHALTIRVTCKRCKRRVLLDHVYKAKKRKNSKRGRRLNPNRPYLLIRMHGSSPKQFFSNGYIVQKTNNDIVQRRSKRHLCIHCALGLYPKDNTNGMRDCCSDKRL